MSYALDPDHAPGREITRIIRQQATRIAEARPETAEDVTGFVHKARVRAKKIRAALRLGRGLMGEKAFKRENRWWRDAARGISSMRDLSARLDALEAVRGVLEPELGRAAVMRLRDRFEKERLEVQSGEVGADAVKAFCDAVAERAGEDPELRNGHADDIMDALGVGYLAARKAMKAAERAGTPEALHEWRKQANAHALPKRVARIMFAGRDPRIEAARTFAERLGELQDVEVLAKALENTGEEKVLELLDERRLVLETRAWTEGRALFEAKAKAWVESLKAAGAVEPDYRPKTEAS